MIYLDHEPCRYCVTYDDASDSDLFRMIALSLLLFILLIYSTRQMLNIVLPFLLTIVTNWLLARYCNTINMWYEIDILTIYLFVWQWVCLIYEWICQDLPYFSFNLHQKAACLYCAFLSFMVYDVLLQCCPTYVKFAFVWIASFGDM